MRITIKRQTSTKQKSRLKKKLRIRKKISGSTEKPRLCIFRSAKHIYAQLIDDTNGQTIVSASTLEIEGVKGANKNSAQKIGEEIAKRAIEKKIKSVIFDRNGYLYHGRVKSLADGARAAGLEF